MTTNRISDKEAKLIQESLSKDKPWRVVKEAIFRHECGSLMITDGYAWFCSSERCRNKQNNSELIRAMELTAKKD